MKLVFTKTLANNVYTINVAVEEVDQADTDLFADFGEPSINIGGEIKSGATVLASLPANYRKIVTQMPLIQRFADKDYAGGAQAVAEAWVLAIQERVNTVVTALRAKSDDFSGTEEFVI